MPKQSNPKQSKPKAPRVSGYGRKPYLKTLFRFLCFRHSKDVALSVCDYLHGLEETLIRSGRYDFQNPNIAILKDIKPDDVESWLNMLAYGTTNPSENAAPIHARASTLYAAKRNLSYYMVTKNEPWSHQSKTGNPTKSSSVNNLIKKVRKKECRNEGAEAQASKAFDREQLLNVISCSKSPAHSCLLVYQNTLIARNDDMCKLRTSEISVNQRIGFDGTLVVKMHWSKNVVDEIQVAPQIIMGAMQTALCPIVRLA